MPYKKQKAIRSNKKRCHLRPNDRFGVSAYLILPIGLLLIKFTYCRMASVLFFQMILADIAV